MTDDIKKAPASATSGSPAPTLLARSDVRVTHATGIGGAISAFIHRVRSGDLGSLPVIVGLAINWTVFTSLNPIFLTSNNLVNLLFDCSTVGVISLGIVCVLMLGEIDLSVGSMSGVGSALIGVLWVNQGVPLLLAIAAALALGAFMGTMYALLRTRLGMPSFVSTLAGLLALLGLQLYMLGSTGSINLPYGSAFVSFGQIRCSHWRRASRRPWHCEKPTPNGRETVGKRWRGGRVSAKSVWLHSLSWIRRAGCVHLWSTALQAI
jgi:D-xylose transport system permease protein